MGHPNVASTAIGEYSATYRKSVTPINVTGTETVYSHSIPRGGAPEFDSFTLAVASAGTISITVVVQTGDARPATESAADAGYTDTETLVTNWTGTSAGVAAKYQCYESPTSNFIRLKITGTGSNDASTGSNVSGTYNHYPAV